MSSTFACDLGLNRKTLSRKFFLLFCFSFSRNFLQPVLAANARFADSIVWKNKSFLWKGHRQEKKLRFCICYLWKMKEKPANFNRGVCFSMKWKATCQNWAHLDEEKQFGLKSHLRASCTQPFNYKCALLRTEWRMFLSNDGEITCDKYLSWLILVTKCIVLILKVFTVKIFLTCKACKQALFWVLAHERQSCERADKRQPTVAATITQWFSFPPGNRRNWVKFHWN